MTKNMRREPHTLGTYAATLLLNELREIQPATVRQLADRLGQPFTIGKVRSTLRSLERRGLVESYLSANTVYMVVGE